MRKSLLLIILAIFVSSFAFSINASWNYTATTSASSPVTLSSPTTLGGPGDDVGYSLSWPFNFQIYDDVYTTSNSIYMTSNGYLRFDNFLAATARYAVIPTANNFYGQFLSYGGNLDGYITSNVVYQVTGTAPNRVLTFAFTYYTYYNLGANDAHADVQVSFYEANGQIVVDYSNVGGTNYLADYLGMNAGDGTFGVNQGTFPTSNTRITYTPGSAINPPATFSATVASSCQNNLTWTKNTSNNDVIIAYNTTNSFGTPANGTSYSVNGSLGSATILYIGSATSYNHTALPSNTHYYYKIWSKSSTNIYSTTGLADDETTNAVTTPGTLSASNVTSTQIDLAWALNGFGDNVIVTYNTVNNFATPQNGTSYSVGNQIGGQQTVLYKGSLLAFQHSGLTINTTYYYKIWSYGCQNDYSSTGQSLTISTANSVNPTFSSVSATSSCEIDLSWSLNSSSDSVMILQNTSSSFATPSNGSIYNVGYSFGSSGKVIYRGLGTSMTASSLLDNQTYYFKAFSIGTSTTYSTGVVGSAQTSIIANPASLTATPISTSQIDLSWPASGTLNVIITYNQTGSFNNPTDGTSYTTAIGSDQIVYKGSATSYSQISGLVANTKYYYKVWYYDCGLNYSTTAATANATTLNISVPDPTAFTAAASSTSGTCEINLTWTKTSGNNVMVVMNTINSFTAPNNSTTYNVGNKFSNGDSVIYYGSGTSKTVSGLVDNSPYYFKAYSYNGTPYYSTGVTANASTNLISNPASLTASPASTTQINLSWPSSGSLNVIVVYNQSGSFTNPIDGTSYTSTIGSNQIIYKGSATSFNHTGLSVNTSYYYKVWYYDCGLNYSSTGATATASTNGVANPQSFGITNTSSCKDSIFWQKNSANDDVVIVFNYTNSFSTPINGLPFVPAPGQTIYTGSANNYVHSPLYSGLKYYYKIYSRTSGTYYYSTGILDSIETVAVPNPSNFQAASGGPTQIDLTWNNNSQGDNVIIAYKTGNSSFGTPSTGTSYATNSTIGANQGTVIYNGSASNFSHTSLSLGTNYYYKVWSYDCGLSYSSGQQANASTGSVSNPTTFSATAISPGQVQLNWSPNSSNDDVIIARSNNNSFGTPTTGTPYNINSSIGSSIVIYTGSGTTTLDVDRMQGTKYYYKIWSKTSAYYYSTGIVDSARTLTVEKPDTLITNAVSAAEIDLSWIKNTNGDSIIVLFNTTNLFATPNDGQDYPIGNQVLTGQGKVIYKGPATSFAHTNLAASTKYYYKIFSYDTADYYSSGILDSATTFAPGVATFPYLETFDTQIPDQSNMFNCQSYYPLTSGWNNVQTVDDIDWVVRQGTTPNGTWGQTGPSGDHTTGNGYYLYTEASSCYNKEAWLVSPLFNFVSLSNPRLEFYYFMLGSGTGSINVQISTNGGTTWSTTNLFNKQGQQQTSQTAAWGHADISLAAYAGMSNIKLRIKGTTGFNYASDMAIDDIRLYQPQNMAVTSIVTEQDTIDVVLGATNQQVIRVNINTLGAFSPLTLGQLGFNTTGTQNTSDISNARVFYTGSNPTFATTQTFGSAIASPSGTFPITGSQVLGEGNNYFWLTYDISSSATIGNKVDAQCVLAVVAGISQTPSITNPTGDKTIVGQIIVGTGTASNYNYGPVYAPYYYGAHESMYLASELGTGAKEINKLAWHKASGTNTTDQIDDITIYMWNDANSSSLTSGGYTLSNYTQVYNGPMPNHLQVGWMDIVLDNTFLWDGTSNLRVLVIQQKPSTTWTPYPYYSCTSVSPNKARGTYNYNSPVTSLPTNQYRPNIKLEYVLPASMSYASSTVEQPNTTNVEKGATNQEIISIKVETNNTANPLALTKLLLSTAGSTSATDIANAKIYYTGSSSTFATTTQFGSTVNAPSGSYTVNGSQTLQPGTNYFWVAYTVSASAQVNNVLDAKCDSITVSGTTYAPTVTNPNGARTIKEYLIVGTGTGSSYQQPLHVYYYHAWEGIYTSTEMGTAKDISALAFYKLSGSNTVNPILNVTIYMKHTTASSVTSGTYSTTGYTQVYNGNFPNNAPSGWMEVPLSNIFAYNGSDNVEILIVQSYGAYFTGYPYWASRTVSPNRARFADSYNSAPTNLTASNQLANIRFEYSDPTPMSYVSSAVTQNNTTNATAGLNDQEIIGLEVVTLNSSNPLSATSFTFNTNGSSAPATDITSAKVYYTGTSSTFAAINQFGTAKSNPNGTWTVTSTQTLQSGTNYFWLAYDIPTTASTGHWVDAECTSLTVGTPRTPAPTSVIGNRTIVGALSGEYTIGTGGDYTTFTSAVSALNTYGVAGWVKFRVLSGTYNEQITLSPYTNSSATNTVTFESYTGDSTDAILSYGSSNSAQNYTLQISGGANYTIKNLTIKATNSTYGRAVSLSGSVTDVDFKNNVINMGSGNNYNSTGIYSYNNNLNNVHISNNKISGTGGYGLYLRSVSTSSNNVNMVVDSNIITASQYGAYLYYNDAIKFRGNQVTVSGNNFTYGIYSYGNSNGIEFSGNNIVSGGTSTAYGLYAGLSTGTSSNRNKIYNNFISVTSNNINNGYGLYLNNTTYLDFAHNNINYRGSATNNKTAAYITGGSNIRLINNMFVAYNGATAIRLNTTSALNTSNNNNFYTTGSTLAYYGNTSAPNLSAWKTYSGMDANSISSNPQFVSTTNLHVTNVALNNLGMVYAEVTTDIDGDLRSATTPDIGADEFSVDIDAGVSAIVNPIAGCNTNQSVDVTFKNFGQTTLTFATINWMLDGVTKTPVTWNGSIATSQTANVNLGNVTLTSGSHTIIAWSSSPNGLTDQITSNDTTTSTFVIGSAPVVNAGSDATICQTSTHTTSATASGYNTISWSTSGTGTFVGGTSLSAVYTPSPADITAGSVYLKLTATSAGCGNVEDSLLLTITTMPSLSFSGLSTTYCPSASSSTLVGSPTGGTFSGPGISGSTFNPSTAGSGTHTIYYKYTLGTCKDSVSQTTTVSPTITPTITGLATGYCLTSNADTLTGLPAGGTWSGAISSNIFNPATVGVGIKTVTYTVINGTTSCVFDTTYTTEVYTNPVATITGLNATYCSNEPADTLVGSPLGGTFAGTGMSGNIFDPATAGVGTHTIEYMINNGVGCSDTATQSVTVNAAPNASFSGLANQYCSTASAVTLSGTPTGGTFTGNGINGNQFDPSTATTGVNWITYTFTGANGCSDTAMQSTIINQTPIANAGPNLTIVNGHDTILYGSATGGSSSYSYSWTPSNKLQVGNANMQNPHTIALTASQVFTLVVTDNNSGCSSSDQMQVSTTGGVFGVTASSNKSVICEGDSVTIEALASGGGGIYNYLWSSSPTGYSSAFAQDVVYPTVTTTYTVIGTDGTSFGSASVVITVNPAPIVTLSGLSSAYCSTAAAVNMVGSPTGGTFSGTGVVGSTFNPSLAGSGNHIITYQYTNGSGCTGTASTTVLVNQTPIAYAGIDDTIYYGSDTILYGSATGGGNYLWSWSPTSKLITSKTQNVTTDTLTSSQQFTLTVTDSLTGCSSADSMIVFIKGGPLNVVASGILTTICSGSTSQLSVLPSGGTGSYSYAWTSIPAGFTSTLQNPIVSPTVTTTYAVVVTSGTQFATDNVTITVNTAPIVSFSGLNAAYCIDDAPSTLIGTPPNGTFSGTGMSANIFDPAVAGAGTHSITYSYTDITTGCTGDLSMNTTVYSLPIANAGTDVTLPAPGVTTLSGSATGGSGFYFYAWTPTSMVVSPTTATTATISLSTTTQFTLTVTDTVSGCFNSDDVIITVGGGNLSVVATAQPDTICAGDASQLTALASGGTGSYTYSWSSNPSGFASTIMAPTVTPTITTTYTVVVNGTVSTSVIVNVNPLPNVSFSGLNSTYCTNDLAAVLTGVPTGGTFSGMGVTGNSFDPASVPQGSYNITYTYTDPNTGCSAFAIQSINVYEAPTANAGSDMTITSGNDTLLYGNATGGGNYKWGWSPTLMVVNAALKTAQTIPLSATQLYTLTVTDSITGCSDNDDVVVYVGNTNLSAVVSSNKTMICAGDSAQLNVLATGGAGGYLYSWSSLPAGFSSSIANPLVKPTVTTLYSVQVTSGSSTVTKNITITVNPKPGVALVGLSSSSCSNSAPDTLMGFPAGGAFSGVGVVSNLFNPVIAGVGTHYISYSYTDINGCSNTDIDTIEVNAVPIANAGIDTTIFTGHDTILYGSGMGGSGNYSYEWSPANQLINAFAKNATTQILTMTQQFTLKLTDISSGCYDYDTVKITVKGGPLTSNPQAFPDTICYGNSTQLDALVTGGSGNYIYLWTSNPAGFTSTSPNPVVTPAVTTTFTVIADDGNGSTINSLVVVVETQPIVQIASYNAQNCSNGGFDTLIGAPAGGVFFGNGITGNFFDPAVAGLGTHQIIYSYTTAGGCSNSDTVSTTVISSPSANAGNDIMIPCGGPGGLIGSNPAFGKVYSWNPTIGLTNPNMSNTIATPNVATHYTLTVTDTLSGCSSTDDVFVDIIGGPVAQVNNDTIICKGESVTISASGGSSFMWSNGVGTSSFTISPNITTTYVVTVTDGACSDVDSVTVTVNAPYVNLGPDVVLIDTTSFVLDAGYGFLKYLWNTGDTVQSINIMPYVNGNLGLNKYSVAVLDAYGCYTMDSINIIYVLTLDELGNEINMNIYPNPSTGQFTIEVKGIVNQKYNLEIMNLTGQKLYGENLNVNQTVFTKDYDFGSWPKGVYLVRISNNGSLKTYKLVIQ